jgi:hypothetical protein
VWSVAFGVQVQVHSAWLLAMSVGEVVMREGVAAERTKEAGHEEAAYAVRPLQFPVGANSRERSGPREGGGGGGQFMMDRKGTRVAL